MPKAQRLNLRSKTDEEQYQTSPSPQRLAVSFTSLDVLGSHMTIRVRVVIRPIQDKWVSTSKQRSLLNRWHLQEMPSALPTLKKWRPTSKHIAWISMKEIALPTRKAV